MNIFQRLVIVAAFASSALAYAQTASSSTFHITGTVVDRLTGQALPNTDVTLALVSARQDPVSFKTGADGRFRFNNLARGKYALAASRRGYELQNYEQHEFFSTAIAVGPELDTDNLLFRLSLAGSIRGTINDDQGEPVANASVRLFGSRLENGESSIRPLSQTATDDRGDYSFLHLAAGTYYIAVSGRPWYNQNGYFPQDPNADAETQSRLAAEARKLDVIYPLTFYSGGNFSDDATPIRLNPGENARADLTLQTVPSLHIRFPLTETTENVAATEGDVNVIRGVVGPGMRRRIHTFASPPRIQLFQNVFGELVPLDTASMSTTSSAGQTIFQYGGIAPDHYIVEVASADPSKGGATYQEMDITADMDFIPTSGSALATVSGIVQLNGATPPENTFIQLRSRNSERVYGGQVKKGEFELDQPVLPGRYEVTLASIGQGGDIYVSAIAASGGKVLGRTTLSITDQPVHLAIVAGKGFAQINGVAKLDDKPRSGAMILLAPVDTTGFTTLIRRDQSDSDGTFTLANIVPGRYHLLAIQNGWDLQWADPKILKPFLASAREYDVRPEQKLQVTVDVQSAK